MILIPAIKAFCQGKGKLPIALLGLAVAGGVLGLSAPGPGLWPLAWVGLVPLLLWVMGCSSLHYAVLGGLSFGLAYHLVYLQWFVGLHPLTWIGFSPELSVVVCLAAWLFAAGCGAVITGLFTVCMRLLMVVDGKARLHCLLIIPLLWVLVQTFGQRTTVGLPWAYLEYTQMAWPIAREAVAILGTTGLGYVIVLCNLGLAYCWRMTASRLTRGLASVAWLGLIAAIVYGSADWGNTLPKPPLPVPVALVQGNLSIETIRAAALPLSTVEKAYLNPLQRLSLPPGALLVLPEEGVFPSALVESSAAKDPMLHWFMRYSRAKQVAVMAGATGLMEKPEGLVSSSDWLAYNSLVFIPPEASSRFYHKRLLVPFGERLPELLPGLSAEAIQAMLKSVGVDFSPGFQAGTRQPLLSWASSASGSSVHIGPLICFEGIYPELVMDYQARGANLLVNTSNLGWFHAHPMIEEQFLAIHQAMAAQARLPIVLATNSGVSAIISSDGSILRRSASRQWAMLYYNQSSLDKNE
jgi:apolipoprotein N-acyltransferase